MTVTRFTQQKNIVAQLLVGPEGQQKDFGVFTGVSGFALEGEKVQHGEGPVAAGVRSRADGELTRPYSELDSLHEKDLEDRYGQQATIIISKGGDDGLPLGRLRTFTGVVGGVSGPEGDATASERGMLTVTTFNNVLAS